MDDFEETPMRVSGANRTKKPFLSAGFLVLLLVVNLIIGLVGGVAGFVVLANGKSTFLTNVRHVLGLDSSNAKVSIPVTQTVNLQENSAVIDAAKKVNPAVVSITANQKAYDLYGQASTQAVSAGSGFILTSDGLIVTNNHVVDQQNVTYKVFLNDGRVFDATVKATDPVNDVAVIQVTAKDLPTVEFGDSDSLQVGQSVIAIGNALGQFSNSVSLGVVSAKQRSIDAGSSEGTSGEHLSGLLQTDAAINEGNSGGPLVNLAGQVVGIDTAIASNSGGSVGIGFAIPINSLKNEIDGIRRTGTVIRPYLGVYYIPVNTTQQQVNNLPVDYGAWVHTTNGQSPIVSGSPADKAGIQNGDILLEVNGEQINENMPLTNLLQKYQPGDKVTMKLRRDGKDVTVTVTLDKAKV